MTTIQTCAACGNTSISPFLICTDYTVSRETFPIMKCNSCSLLITSPRPENDALSKYYQSENYISHTGKANNLIHFLYLQIRKITLANKRELLESLTEDKSLLDFGCGTGSLINYLHQYKWKVAGYEPNLVTSTDSNENVPIYKNQESLLSEQYKGVGLSKFFKALYRGFISNAKARKTGEYSSLIYIARP